MPRSTAPLLLILCLLLTAGCGSFRQHTTHPIPPLDPKGDVYKTLGPNDPLIYLPALGQRKAVLLYVDFDDRPQSGDTVERGEKLLANGAFEKLFHDNSYGKLTLNVTQLHGWRRMPKPASSYDSGTTEAHRDFFADIFALYPETDLSQYDYIMVSVNAVGNTAFGERDDLAIPYRGKKIKTALNVGSMSYFTLAHELAHCMGLPDLYTYGDLEPKNPAGPWSIMSSSNGASGFIGWHRHKLGWLDADRKTYLTQGTHTIHLTPLDGDEGVSMIAVPADDADQPSKVFVIEIAQPLRIKQEHKPAGVLIYSVDARLATGENPLVIQFGQSKDMANAAYHEGETFDQDNAPMSVKVLKKNEDGSYEVEIKLKK